MTRKTGQEIIQELIDLGETQLSIEAGSGVAQATISRILTGKAEDPRSSTVEKLSVYADLVRHRIAPESGNSAAA